MRTCSMSRAREDEEGQPARACGLDLDAAGRCSLPWGAHVSSVCGTCPMDEPHTCVLGREIARRRRDEGLD